MRPFTPPGFKPRPQRGQVFRVPIPDEQKRRPAVVIRVEETARRALIVYFTTTRKDHWGERIEVTFGTRDFQMLGLENTSFAYGGSKSVLPTVRLAAFEHLYGQPSRCPPELLLQLTKLAEDSILRMTPEQLLEDLPDSPTSSSEGC